MRGGIAGLASIAGALALAGPSWTASAVAPQERSEPVARPDPQAEPTVPPGQGRADAPLIARTRGDERKWTIFEREITPRALLAALGEAADLPVEGEPEKLGGPFILEPGRSFTAGELSDLVHRELASRGFTTIQPPGALVLRVVPFLDAASLARLEASNLAGARAGFVKLLVPLEHRQADEVVETLRLLISKSGLVTAVRDGNSVLVADQLEHAEQALLALKLLDETGEPAIEEFRPVHLGPTGMAALLERLAAAQKEVAGDTLHGKVLPLSDSGSLLVIAPEEEMDFWRTAIERFDREAPLATVGYAPRRFGLAETAELVEELARGAPGEPWKVHADPLTGTLFVTASQARHEEVRAVLARLESTPAGPSRPVRTIEIHHRRVSEVLALLDGLIDAGVLEQPAIGRQELPPDPRPGDPLPGATGAIGRPVSPAGEVPKVTLAADEGTNRLIALGEPHALDQIEAIVAQLDVRHAQVLLEAIVVSLTEDETLDLGVELQKIGVEDGTLYQLGSLFGLGSVDPASTELQPLGATGASGTLLDPGEFSALVQALETVNEGRSLARPKVLVSNNQEAHLDSVLQTPYASTNASQTVATTSFGGTLDAGTSIMVKPQVADGDSIVLAYTISLSRFTGEQVDPSLPPPREEQRLQSVVTIPDGHAVIVGGLELESEAQGASQVPLLGDLPLVGALFEASSRSERKTRFFVFLRASAIQSATFEDLKYMSRPALAAAGVDDGFPRLEPRVIR